MKQEEGSYFDGKLIQMIGWRLLTTLISVVSLGLAVPSAICMMKKWEVKHTVIGGKRLTFDGRGIQLFGNWIKWLLLTIVTLGIFSLWIPIKVKKWVAKHIDFAQ